MLRRLAAGVPKARIAARLGISRTTAVKAVASYPEGSWPSTQAADRERIHGAAFPGLVDECRVP